MNAIRFVPANVCVAFSLVCLLSINLDAQTTDTQNIQALIEEAESKAKELGTRLQGYKYTMKRIEQELNDKNEVKAEKVNTYQVFTGPDGTPIWMLLSENGKELSHEQLIKEKRRVNKQWEKARKEAAKPKAAKQAPVSFFSALDFSMLRMERLNGRETVVLKFTPKPIKGSTRFMSQLEGEAWIDLKDKALARVDAKLSERYKVGGGFLFPAYLEPGTSIFIESAPLSNGLWAIAVMEFTPVPKSSFALKIPRGKQREERSEYTPFDQSVNKIFADL